jgi:hypothetical protein
MSKDSMRILEYLINFIENLIARKISFLESNWVSIGRNWSLGDWNWILKSLISQIRGLIVKKLKFDSQLGVQLKKFKTKDQIIKDARFQRMNWLNQGLNCRKLKVWWLIKDLSSQIGNYGSRWK